MLVFTNLPTMPLLAIGGGCVGLAMMLTRKQQADDSRRRRRKAKAEHEEAGRGTDRGLSCRSIRWRSRSAWA